MAGQSDPQVTSLSKTEVEKIRQGKTGDIWQALETTILSPLLKERVVSEFTLSDDQVVWGRAPVRMDLAGGWTDTPPYCLEYGGSVLNMALNLNGQPPIQVFARRTREYTIRLHSIDLGKQEVLTTYDEASDYKNIGGGFSIAKAALALAGFHPRFNGDSFPTLKAQLKTFGGGIELSMLAGLPKGSGMGTSSILAGAVLGVLNRFGNLSWSLDEIAGRVSAVEQMIGSGGGWQDQFGGLLQGAKLIQTKPGMQQLTSVRWLPSEFFTQPELQERSLLYFTGITRVAHDVLGNVVQGMFSRNSECLALLEKIGDNSIACHNAIQQFDTDAFSQSIARSWNLNERLNQDTNPIKVQTLLDRVTPYLSCFKLAGAGGGGFLYMVAKDAQKAKQLRRKLSNNPPNPLARFVDMSLSTRGLEVSTS